MITKLSDFLSLDEIPSFHSFCDNTDKTKPMFQYSVIHYSIGKTLRRQVPNDASKMTAGTKRRKQNDSRYQTTQAK